MVPDPRRAGYWVENGSVVYAGYSVRGTDPSTFVCVGVGPFAKDDRNCYCAGIRIKQMDAASFHALNFTFVSDGAMVWCLGGQVGGADASSFLVCDDGRYSVDASTVVPHSYGKDDHAVFYYNFDGKAHVVRGAEAASFSSMGDGLFGADANSVFFDGVRIKAAERSSWRQVGGLYSADGIRVFYGNRILEGADLATFRFVPSRAGLPRWAVDCHRRYDYGAALDSSEYSEEVWKQDAVI
jgi:hypothetical protein